jgi:hypothetical protein
LADGKQFKFQLKSGGKDLYLTSSGTTTANKAQGVDCTLAGSSITCGGGGLGSSMHTQLVPKPGASNNKNWSIGADNEIKYAGFNIATRGSQVYAENCKKGGHPDGSTFTTVKAYAAYE